MFSMMPTLSAECMLLSDIVNRALFDLPREGRATIKEYRACLVFRRDVADGC